MDENKEQLLTELDQLIKYNNEKIDAFKCIVDLLRYGRIKLITGFDIGDTVQCKDSTLQFKIGSHGEGVFFAESNSAHGFKGWFVSEHNYKQFKKV